MRGLPREVFDLLNIHRWFPVRAGAGTGWACWRTSPLAGAWPEPGPGCEDRPWTRSWSLTSWSPSVDICSQSGALEPSHWFSAVQILCSDWWTHYNADAKFYAIPTHLWTSKMPTHFSIVCLFVLLWHDRRLSEGFGTKYIFSNIWIWLRDDCSASLWPGGGGHGGEKWAGLGLGQTDHLEVDTVETDHGLRQDLRLGEAEAGRVMTEVQSTEDRGVSPELRVERSYWSRSSRYCNLIGWFEYC